MRKVDTSGVITTFAGTGVSGNTRAISKAASASSKRKPASQYWLVKQEPEAYSWDDLVRDRGTEWTGVRNFQARNNLRQMKVGDRVLFLNFFPLGVVPDTLPVRVLPSADTTVLLLTVTFPFFLMVTSSVRSSTFL